MTKSRSGIFFLIRSDALRQSPAPAIIDAFRTAGSHTKQVKEIAQLFGHIGHEANAMVIICTIAHPLPGTPQGYVGLFLQVYKCTSSL